MSRLADAYEPCPCGSGKKFRFCCMKGYGAGKYPIGTIAHYGPDNKTCTKIAAAVILNDERDTVVERFLGDNVFGDPAVSEKIRALFAKHKVAKVAAFNGIIGCPHEEKVDFPVGEECPHCPWWRGKQDSFEDRYEHAQQALPKRRKS
jgi:hypothetical protein